MNNYPHTVPALNYFTSITGQEVALTNRTFKKESNQVVSVVSDVFGVNPDAWVGKRTRNRDISMMRQLTWLMLRQIVPAMSLVELGNIFGGYDHATVSHGIESISNCMLTDKKIVAIYDKIKRKLGNFHE